MPRTKLMVEELSKDYAQALQETVADRVGAAIFRFDEGEGDDFMFKPGLAEYEGKLERQEDYIYLNHGSKTVPPGYTPHVDTNEKAIDERWRVQARHLQTGRVACLLMCDERVDIVAWRQEALASMARKVVRKTVRTEGAA